MKKFNYIFGIIFLGAFLFSSCEEAELYPKFGEEDGQSSVSFVNASSNVNESRTISYADGTSVSGGANTEIQLVRRSSDISSELSVAVSFTATYVSDNDFVTAGEDASDAFKIVDDLSSIVFNANEATAAFTITTVDDVLPAGDVQIVFEITSVSDNKYQIGEQSGNSRSTTVLTLIDDDCPIDVPGTWEGVYEVREFPAAPGSFNEGFTVGAAAGLTVLVELDESDPLGASVILKPTESNSLLVDEMPMTFEVCPQTILIGPDAYTLAFNQNGAPASIGRTDEPATYGNGTFNPDGSTFTIVVSYGNTASGLVFDEFLLTLDRVEE